MTDKEEIVMVMAEAGYEELGYSQGEYEPIRYRLIVGKAAAKAAYQALVDAGYRIESRWVKGSWIDDKDTIHSLSAKLRDAKNTVAYLENQLDALRNEQYDEFQRLVNGLANKEPHE